MLVQVVLLLAQIAVVLPWDDPRERPLENGQWLCWMYSGKGAWGRKIEKPESLEYYLKGLPAFDQEIQWRVKNEPNWDQITSATMHIGAFGGGDVVDVLFALRGNPTPFGKMVLLGKAGLFRPVIWILDDVGAELSRSTIIQVSGQQVLVNRCRISGTGNFYYEDYLVFDQKNQIPVNLRADAVTKEAEARLLPQGATVRKGGGFDISSLTYQAGVSRDSGDGGRITMQFKLTDNQLLVTSAKYDPSYQWWKER